MNKIGLGIIALLLAVCRPVAQQPGNKQDTGSQTPVLQKLDSLSVPLALPYGRKEVQSVNFPRDWYCGGGYLENSLKAEGLDDKDSIRYAAAYASLLAFNRDVDTSTRTHIELKQLLTAFDEFRADSVTEVRAFIRLPEVQQVKVYGILIRKGDYFFNPCYITVKNGKIIDRLGSYEYSRGAVQRNRISYIDTQYIFHVRSFTNTDGYQVRTGEVERYRVLASGRFERISVAHKK